MQNGRHGAVGEGAAYPRIPISSTSPVDAMPKSAEENREPLRNADLHAVFHAFTPVPDFPATPEVRAKVATTLAKGRVEREPPATQDNGSEPVHSGPCIKQTLRPPTDPPSGLGDSYPRATAIT